MLAFYNYPFSQNIHQVFIVLDTVLGAKHAAVNTTGEASALTELPSC